MASYFGSIATVAYSLLSEGTSILRKQSDAESTADTARGISEHDTWLGEYTGKVVSAQSSRLSSDQQRKNKEAMQGFIKVAGISLAVVGALFFSGLGKK